MLSDEKLVARAQVTVRFNGDPNDPKIAEFPDVKFEAKMVLSDHRPQNDRILWTS